MPTALTPELTEEIQKRYYYLVNYETDDPNHPIDPMTYCDSNGDYLLHVAARRGDLRTVELLIGAGLDVNLIGDMGSTALHYAKSGGHTDVVDYLIRKGASTAIRDEFGHLPGEGQSRT